MAGGGATKPSGTHRPQLTSQYAENHAAEHSCVSVAQFSQVASGQSGSGGGGASTQGLGAAIMLLSAGAPPLPAAAAAPLLLSLLVTIGNSASAPRSPGAALPGPTALGAVLPAMPGIGPPAPALSAGGMAEKGTTVVEGAGSSL